MSNISVDAITMVLIAVLVVMFVLLAIFCILYFKSKSKKEEDKIISGTDSKNAKAGQTTKTYAIESVFDFMEFDKIEDNMVITKNGTKYVMVVECQGVNYDLMSSVEKNAVEEGFIQFLNTLRHPVQIYTQTRTINLENSIQTYRNKVQEIEEQLEKEKLQYDKMVNSGNYTEEEIKAAFYELTKTTNLYEYGKDIIFNTERMSLNKNVLRKQYYIVIPYYSSEAGNDLFDKDEIRNIAFSELYTKAQSIIRTLAGCSVTGKVLDSYELVDLLYNAYNRDEAETYGMKKALQAGYDELYITAQDVLDKKIKTLDAQIQEKAMEEARTAIEEVKSEKQKQLEQKELTMDDLIADMAAQILEESKSYIGQDVAKEAKKRIKTKDKGGEKDGKKAKAKSTSRTTK